MPQQVVGALGFHHLAQLQYGHIVGNLADHTHVVGDEQNSSPLILAQLADQAEDLRLGCHIQRCRGLVSDQQLRAHHQRHRDHDPLALPA